jgi:hypothetical protein
MNFYITTNNCRKETALDHFSSCREYCGGDFTRSRHHRAIRKLGLYQVSDSPFEEAETMPACPATEWVNVNNAH